MVASGTKDVGFRRLCQNTRKMDLGEFHYRRVFRGNKAVECFLLKGVRVTAEELLRRRAESYIVRRSDEEQRADNARLRSKVK